MTTIIVDTMDANKQLLYDGVGLFEAKGSLNRSEWKRYIDATKMEKHYPGIQGIGYSAVLQPNELQHHIQDIRAEGFSGYSVHPEGSRDFYTPVIYLEPFNERNQRAFGYDMFTESVRRQAIIQAIESTQASMSGKVRLIQENGTDEQAGLLLYVPLYKKNMPLTTRHERWAAIQGVVFAPLRTKKLFSHVLKNSITDIKLRIYDGNSTDTGTLLFDSSPKAKIRNDLSFNKTVSINGRHWILEYSALENFDRDYDAQAYLIILISGFAISFLLYGLLNSLARTKEKAQSLADAMTKELHDNKEELSTHKRLFQTILDAIPHIILLKDRDGKFVYANQTLADMYGTTSEAMMGKDDTFFTGDKEQTDMFTKFIQETIASGKTQTYYKDVKNPKTGEIRNYQSIKKPISIGSDGNTNVLIVSSDFTEMHELNKTIADERHRYKTLMELASDGVHILDTEGKLIEFSDSFAKMLGYSREEMKDFTVHNWEAMIPSDDLIAVLNEYMKEPVTFETKHRRKDGTIRDVQIVASGLEIDGKMYQYASARDISEQKRYQDNLQNMLEQSPIAVRIVKQGKREVIFANQAYARLIQSDKISVIGKNPRDYYANKNEFDAIVTRLENNETIINKLVQLTINGQAVWALASYIPMEFDGEECILGWFYDITEQIKLQEELVKQRDFVDTIFDTAKTIMAVIDQDGRMIRFNKMGEEVMGYSQEEVASEPFFWARFLLPDQQADVIKMFEHVHENGIKSRYINDWIGKDGKQHTFDWSNSLIPIQNGTAQYLVTIGIDITEQKKVQESLKQQKEELETIFNISRDGIAVLDLESRFLEVNAAYLNMTGFTREELLATSCIELSTPETRLLAIEAINIALKQGFLDSFEKTCIVKNGKRVTVSMSVSLMPDQQRFLISVKDITQMKEHEHQLEYIAHYDPLTGLPNRILQSDRLRQSMMQVERRGVHIAIVYLDLDGFKGINDSYGHAAGDQLLIELSVRMRQGLREGDTLSRIGGDEFIAILPDLSDTSAALPIINRLLEAAAEPVLLGDLLVHVSASIGVTFYPQNDDMDADQLIRQADQAMYKAKQSGKNHYHIFNPEDDTVSML
ncbi:PAS domain S-box protein [Sulfuricurvum sp.]|uniref:PAS domain S-box protein n=1 Tax=Sulfuricurvum sp. TaxID=2025608 RepID=UPI003569DB84